jgi:hypothetical protein
MGDYGALVQSAANDDDSDNSSDKTRDECMLTGDLKSKIDQIWNTF